MFQNIPVKSIFLGAALLGLPIPVALAQSQPGAVQALQGPPPADKGPGGRGGGPLAGLLTPEQRAMFMEEARPQVKAMAPDQRRAWRKEQIQKIMAMSPAQRQAFQSDLQAHWDALPAARKDRIEQRLTGHEPPPPAQ